MAVKTKKKKSTEVTGTIDVIESAGVKEEGEIVKAKEMAAKVKETTTKIMEATGEENKSSESSLITSSDIQDLKSDEDLLPETEKVAPLPIAPQPLAKPGKSLSTLNKEIRAQMKAEGISTRAVSSESMKSYAISRMAIALAKRGWIVDEEGIYTLSEHKLSIDTNTFEADVDGYALPLGKDALKTLDQYVALSKVSASSGIIQASS